MKQILAIAGLAVVMASCNTNYEKTKSGLAYKIFKGKGEGTALKAGMFAKLNIEYLLTPKDTVLNSTYGKVPLFTPIDTGAKNNYSFMELLPKCKQGDSVIFTISVDSLKSKGAIPEYNELFKRGDQIKCKMTVLKTFTNENDIRADYEKEMAAEKDRETKAIKDYLAKNGIKAEQTKNGAFVQIENAGDAQKAQPGKVASIMYKGYFLTDVKKVFDTNMDTSKGHTDPIKVPVGQGQVIPGWEEALPYFGKGGKGKIFVPAMLAYGPQGSQGAIPPYSNLIFDIEVRDVSDAPKQTAPSGQQGMNNLTPEQIQQLQQQMQQQQQQGGQQQDPRTQQAPH
jgi:FKBP-type peptidyl-prolyl cis-trans isomerase FkpA